MATVNVNPGGFASAYAAASNDDTLILQPGNHQIAAASGRFTLNKRLNIIAANRTPGMFVTGSNGHNFDAISVRVTGAMQISSGGANSVLAGFGWQDNWASGPGTCVILANGVRFEDLVISNRRNGQAGTIFFTLGGSARPDGLVFRRIRSRLNGDPAAANHDHPYYIKNCVNTLIEDCIDYEGTDGWCLHFYPNGDNTLVRRTVIYQHTGGLTFSGATDASTGLSGYLTSDNNVVETSILMNSTRAGRYLVESYWSSTPGVGNTVRNSNVYQGAGSGGRISTSNGGFTTSNLQNTNPLFTDPANGDFTLAANSPSIGYGPTYIQPGNSPQTPPPPVTNLAANALTGPTRVSVTWTNPASMTNRAVEIFRSTAPISSTTGLTALTSTTGTSYTDSTVAVDTDYWYVAEVVENALRSSSSQVTVRTGAGDPPPPPSNPTEGEEYVGKWQIGGTWRAMSGDYKRASRFQLESGKRITEITAYLRGTGTSGSHPIKAFVYEDATGVLLGVTDEESVSNTLEPAYVTFTPASPINGPGNGGTIRIGLHTGTGNVQVATDVVTGGLLHGGDTYVDGTDASWLSPMSDTYELTIYALVEDVPASSELAASSSTVWSSSGQLTETGTPSAIPASDVVYRMDTEVITYQIPTPYQVSTGAKLRWDSDDTQYVYAED